MRQGQRRAGTRAGRGGSGQADARQGSLPSWREEADRGAGRDRLGPAGAGPAARSGVRHQSARRHAGTEGGPLMASTKDRFETVAAARGAARKKLPKSVFLALHAGSEAGGTLADNTAAFAELGLRPRIADLPAERQQSTTVLGVDISLPVIVSPTGVQAVHPDGEVAVAKGAAQSGTAIGLSSFGSKPIEEVMAVNDNTLFQVYWQGSRDDMLARMDRARRAGAKALIVT